MTVHFYLYPLRISLRPDPLNSRLLPVDVTHHPLLSLESICILSHMTSDIM